MHECTRSTSNTVRFARLVAVTRRFVSTRAIAIAIAIDDDDDRERGAGDGFDGKHRGAWCGDAPRGVGGVRGPTAEKKEANEKKKD